MGRARKTFGKVFQSKSEEGYKKAVKKKQQKKTKKQIEYFTPGERSDRENFLVEAYCLKGIFQSQKQRGIKGLKNYAL